MRKIHFVPSLLLALAVGCTQSSTPTNTDAATDAATDGPLGLDSGTDAGTDAGPPPCGNQTVDDGEECDDGNQQDDDSCANDCTLNPLCGDGTTESPEECDDGNNHSGDGCSGACTEEACGNARLDPGEVCDGSPGCATTCDAVTTCGNGMLDGSEQCDLGDVTAWDGCSAACEYERAVVLSELDLLQQSPCDLNGDGRGDSALGSALGLAWTQVRTLVNDILADDPFNVLVFRGVDDPTFAADDADVRIGWVRGVDANGTGPDFDGTGQVRVQAGSLTGGEPTLTLAGSITSGLLEAGPEDVAIPFFGSFQLGVKRARVVMTPLTVSGTPPATIVSVGTLQGRLCGGVSVGPFASLPNVVGSFGLPGIPTNSCDTSVVSDAGIRLSDVIVGGVLLDNFVDIVVPTQPDVDMDGDGLEQYVVVSGTSCQAVIASCIDGDGTPIPGRSCVNDPRMADTISAAFSFTAPTTTLVP